METLGGDGSETGSVAGEKKIYDLYWCQPHRGLEKEDNSNNNNNYCATKMADWIKE